MTDKTQPTTHAEITAPISADLRRMPGLSEQDAGLLEQAASMLEGLQNDERNRGNCSTAEGAGCSADAVRRLAVQLLRSTETAQCLHQGAEPDKHMTIGRALREGLRAEPWISGEPGAAACVGLCAIQLQGWWHTAETAKAYADAYNRGADDMRAALQAAPPAPAAVAVPAASEVLDALNYVDDFVARCNGDDRGSCASVNLLRAALAAAPTQPAAWMTPEGDRVVTEATMASARKDGGAMLSSLRPFTVALARAAAPAQAWPSECDSPELCQVHRGCAGQYGTKNTCPSFAVLNPCNSAAPAQEHATQLAGQDFEVIEKLLRLAQIVDRAVEDWGESFPDGSCDVKFHKDEAVKMEAILEFFDSLPDAPEDEGVIESGPLKAARAIRAAAPAQAQEDARDAVRALIATHAEMLEDNAYAYFELAYTRQTGWMAWITDKPLYGAPVVNPDRKVLAQCQGDTPDEACAEAARAAQGGA